LTYVRSGHEYLYLSILTVTTRSFVN